MDEQVSDESSHFRMRQEGQPDYKNSTSTPRLRDVFMVGMVQADEIAGLNIAGLTTQSVY